MPPQVKSPSLPDYLVAIALVVAATGAAAVGRAFFDLADIVMIYVSAIMVTAVAKGRRPALLASALSVAAYDLFFVPPVYTFRVADLGHLITFSMMFIVGLLISSLTTRIREQELAARAREVRTAALYALSRDLGQALDATGVANATVRHASRVFHGTAAVLTADLAVVARAGPEPASEARSACMRLGRDDVLLVFPGEPLAGEERRLLEAFVRQAALALERSRLEDEAKAAALRARTEEMRSALLSAVSHDLRTPLAAITGSATTLRESMAGLRAEEREELVDAICEEADRLERLVTNLLDMTRLDSGALEVHREWIPLEEMVGSALNRLDHQLGSRDVRVVIDADAPLVPVDPVLFEQVLVNLLENIAKYTPADSPVEIHGTKEKGGVALAVLDRGPGLDPGSETRVFEKFFRGSNAGVRGAGLGLAVVRGIVAAHGGEVSAQNRAGGGLAIHVRVPIVGAPPSLPAARPEEARL